MCLVWFDSEGLEFEVDICALAVADALEDGLLVTGDVVAADVKDRQCPDGGNAISRKVGSGLYSSLGY